MKKVTSASENLKVTLTKDKLKFRNLKSLQTLTRSLNLSISIGKVEFTREQLIDNLLKLAKGEKEYTPKGSYAVEDLKKLNFFELVEIVKGLGFKPGANVTSEALMETILTFKGPAAVFPAPAEKANKTKDAEIIAAAVATVRMLKENNKFRYPTSKTEYVVIPSEENIVKIQNLKTEQIWRIKSDKELDRNVVVL